MAKRRRAGSVVLATAAALAAGTLSAMPASAQLADDLERGRELYVGACISCHGARGRGTENGVPLRDVGAASVDFMVRTGRMPLANPDVQAQRKPPAFASQDISDLVAYVSTFGEGPLIPEVDVAAGDLAAGERLFVSNCAPCHGATATGGAVGAGALAPSLMGSEPLDVAEATIIGPGQMPVFGFSEEERNAIVAFVAHLQESGSPGGADIGGIGPVPEGFVAWVLGMGALVLVSVLMARHRTAPRRGRP